MSPGSGGRGAAGWAVTAVLVAVAAVILWFAVRAATLGSLIVAGVVVVVAAAEAIRRR